MAMKLKCYLPVLAAVSLLVAFPAEAGAQDSQPANTPSEKSPGQSPLVAGTFVDPATGLPTSVDPTTGLPASHEWIDAAWDEPSLVLTNIDFDGLPLSEVVRRLREWFKGSFDVLPFPEGNTDWGSTIINLKLTNVKAADLINAMNLLFENSKFPVRWQLVIYHDHPYLILRDIKPSPIESAANEPKIRRIFFVGDLLGDGPGGMTMEKMNETISDLWKTSFGSAPMGNIGFHQESQMLVFSGTAEQADFIQLTLAALKERSQWLRKTQNLVLPFPPPAAGTNVPSVNAAETK